MKKLGKYSFGVGDRFSHEGEAQLQALMKARRELSLDITPVWNKSNREHTIVGSEPIDTRIEADNAVKALGYEGDYYVDADHINLHNVDRFLSASDFFTIDVADYIGQPADAASIKEFVTRNAKYCGALAIPGMEPIATTTASLEQIASKFLFATQEAGRIYRHIAQHKGEGNFITEVSMDEVNDAQTPVELFFILSALAAEGIPAQTIAPKFTGRFNKGVDYVGDIAQFSKEFEQDLLVIDYAVKEFGLPDNLKLSIHSGSDKFSIYPIMGQLIRKHDKGIHVKTAGTTWLEEVIGLSLADAGALQLAKEIYAKSLGRFDELCIPYATVIDIDKSRLPSPDEVTTWNGQRFADTLRHDPSNVNYNPNFRQLIHVSYKIAAEYEAVYTDALKRNKAIVGIEVCSNLYDRHIRRMFT